MLWPLTEIEEEVETTCPVAFVERTEFGMPRMRLVVEAVVKKPSPEALKTVVEAPPLKVWRFEKVFVVVVLNAVEKTPVVLLYESGYVADKEDEEILLLKVVQSVEAR